MDVAGLDIISTLVIAECNGYLRNEVYSGPLSAAVAHFMLTCQMILFFTEIVSLKILHATDTWQSNHEMLHHVHHIHVAL